jgi:hypothetical protein
MAVKSSGIIGITTDIVAEFTGVAPHGLTEYYRGGTYVPNNATNSGIPTSGVIGLTQFYNAVNVTYFMSRGLASGEDLQGYSIVSTPSALVMGGRLYNGVGSPVSKPYTSVIAPDSGTITNVKTFGNTSTTFTSEYINEMKYNSTDGGIWAVGGMSNAGSYLGIISKLYSNGSPQYYKSYGASSVNYNQLYNLAVHTDGTVYVAGASNTGFSNIRGLVAQANSIAGLAWQRQITTNTTQAHYISAIGVDSTGNLYVNHDVSLITADFLPAITKYDTAGNRLWTYSCSVGTAFIATGGQIGSREGILFDSSGNGYAIIKGMTTVAGDYGFPPAQYEGGILKFGPTGSMHLYAKDTLGFDFTAGTIDNNILYYILAPWVITSVNTSLSVGNTVSVSAALYGTGTLSTSSGSATVTGVGTDFDFYDQNRTLYFSNGVSIGTISTVESTTSVTLSAAAAVTTSSQTYFRSGDLSLTDIEVVGSEVICSGSLLPKFSNNHQQVVIKIPKTLNSLQTTIDAGKILIKIESASYTLTTVTPTSVTARTPTTSTPSVVPATTSTLGVTAVSITQNTTSLTG